MSKSKFLQVLSACITARLLYVPVLFILTTHGVILMSSSCKAAPGISHLQRIPFGKGNYISYDLATGKYDVFFNDKKVIEEAFASCKSDKLYDSRNYVLRKYTSSAFSDILGKGIRYVITLSSNGQLKMQQIFYVYSGKDYFYTQVKLLGKGADCNFMSPLTTGKVNTFENGDNRALFVPFDNDAWVRYNAVEMDKANFTSGEVTVLYNSSNNHGLVIGSVDHYDWKSGVSVKGTKAGYLSQLSVFGGYTDTTYTHDRKGHGWVSSGDTVCRSPRMLVGWFIDWRTGMEEYGKVNSKEEPRYIFSWKAATPVGWNSWGVMQDKLTLAKAKGVVDFFADSCSGFRNGDSTLYIDLDAYWDGMCPGGITGDLSNLKDFCQYCKSKGFRPGVYWAPFADWGKNSNKVVEGGSSWHYGDCWTSVNGSYMDLDGGRAMDPTHPATRTRIALYLDRLKSCGFQMIKIDFLGHGALEADHYYDSSVHTGMQAFRKGMEYVIDQLDGKMLVYAAISPSLATGRYVHMRRIACDAFKRIDETAYTLNSTTYGWWLGKIYNYMDADHLVLGAESDGANRARLASLVITGTLITGDDYSARGPWLDKARTLLQNQDILQIVHNGQSFRPVKGNTGNQAGNSFICFNGNYLYLAIVNYDNTPLDYTIDPAGLGLRTGAKDFAMKELFSGINTSVKEKLKISVKPSDAVIYRIDIK